MIAVKRKPVWFGCDAGKFGDKDLGLWDVELLDYKGAYGVDVLDEGKAMTKADRLVFGESLMTHAMVFTGMLRQTVHCPMLSTHREAHIRIYAHIRNL